MAARGGESDHARAGRQFLVVIVLVALGVVLGAMDESAQQRVAGVLRGSVLRPFLALQEGFARARTRAGSVDELRARMDSLTSVVTTQSVLAEENETLRRLLGLSARLGPSFRSATVLRPGTPGSESMFLLDVGSADGVAQGAPVIGPDGLVGVVRDVGPSSAVGMDWTHPDFRASAMVPGTEVYGIVENRRGTFREEDRLVLTGAAYNEVVPDGSPVVTSGLGGVYPRGVPIGTIDEVADYQGAWRKSYWIRPSVLPGSVTHVLVAVGHLGDSLAAWSDTVTTGPAGGMSGAGEGGTDAGAPAVDSLGSGR